jgi:hypothetical protein
MLYLVGQRGQTSGIASEKGNRAGDKEYQNADGNSGESGQGEQPRSLPGQTLLQQRRHGMDQFINNQAGKQSR